MLGISKPSPQGTIDWAAVQDMVCGHYSNRNKRSNNKEQEIKATIKTRNQGCQRLLSPSLKFISHLRVTFGTCHYLRFHVPSGHVKIAAFVKVCEGFW